MHYIHNSLLSVVLQLPSQILASSHQQPGDCPVKQPSTIDLLREVGAKKVVGHETQGQHSAQALPMSKRIRPTRGEPDVARLSDALGFSECFTFRKANVSAQKVDSESDSSHSSSGPRTSELSQQNMFGFDRGAVRVSFSISR